MESSTLLRRLHRYEESLRTTEENELIALLITPNSKGILDDARIHIGPSMISLQFMLGKGGPWKT